MRIGNRKIILTSSDVWESYLTKNCGVEMLISEPSFFMLQLLLEEYVVRLVLVS